MMLHAATVTGGIAVSGTLLAACGGDSAVTESTRIARLLAPMARAASDDAVAARSLISRNPDRAAALAVIAGERQVHATTLNDEVARMAPDLARPSTNPAFAAVPTTTSSGSPGSGPSIAPAAPAVSTIGQLRGRLSAALTSTGDLAITMSGYRAGMLGSIAASLATQVEVQLG